MKIEFVAAAGASEVLAVLVGEDRALAGTGPALDTAASGSLTKAMTASRFTGAANSTLTVAAPAGVEAATVLLVGAGKDALDEKGVETAAGAAYHAVKLSGAETLTLDFGHLTPEQSARAAFAVRLAAYTFNKYRTTLKPEKIASIKTVRVVTSDLRAAEAAYEPMSAVADAVTFARDLVSEPANVLYPAEFAKRVKALDRWA
jgi:leucyl aminopeptidase